MKHSTILSILLLICASSVFAQADAATAPAVWERYKLGDEKISIELPKMPVRIGSQNLCLNFDKSSYFAYADESIYEVTVVAKSSLPIPVRCGSREVFSDATLTARLTELRSGKPEMAETSLMQNDRQSYRFSGGLSVRWVIPDMDKNRWVEIATVRREDKKSLDESFVKSLDLNGGTGKEIGKGSLTTLGDPLQATDIKPAANESAAEPPSSGPEKTIVTEPVQIIAKPKASYTDAARKANLEGSTRMKITLRANGSVGSISPVTELSHGLTEQAIAVARKIVFLPARVNGVPISKIVIFEYHFNIY